MSIVDLQFTNIVKDVPGSEGPVFDKHGNCFMVAPFAEKEGKTAGQVLRVDLEKKQVSQPFK